MDALPGREPSSTRQSSIDTSTSVGINQTSIGHQSAISRPSIGINHTSIHFNHAVGLNQTSIGHQSVLIRHQSAVNQTSINFNPSVLPNHTSVGHQSAVNRPPVECGHSPPSRTDINLLQSVGINQTPVGHQSVLIRHQSAINQTSINFSQSVSIGHQLSEGTVPLPEPSRTSPTASWSRCPRESPSAPARPSWRGAAPPRRTPPPPSPSRGPSWPCLWSRGAWP